jgi:hypothetical protein
MMHLILVGLAGLLVLDVAVNALSQVLRHHEDRAEQQARRRVLRDLGRYE